MSETSRQCGSHLSSSFLGWFLLPLEWPILRCLSWRTILEPKGIPVQMVVISFLTFSFKLLLLLEA